jgi:hypothetical protein
MQKRSEKEDEIFKEEELKSSRKTIQRVSLKRRMQR